jgi:homoprotocatechuate degradation regulator HpaR
MDMTAPKPAVNVKLRSFSKSLPMTLLLAREAVMNRFRPTLNLFNITEQQWRVLRALTSVKEIEVMELAKVTYLLAPSLSRILRDMEARGLIERRQAPEDLRRSLISISPKGLKLIDAVAPYSESIYAEIAETFGKQNMEALQQFCKELTQSLNALPPISYTAAELSEDIGQIVGTNSRGRPRFAAVSASED